MSFHVNSVVDEPLNNQQNIPQNNLLLYNSNNYKYQGKNDMLYYNVLNNKNNSLRPIYLINNINNYTSSTIVNNRKGSLDKNFYSSKKGKAFNMNNSLRLNRNLSSSGILKASRRDQRFDRVLKKGKKLKNIDINRDYDEDPEDDLSSNMSSNSNMFKNKLGSSIKKNSSDNSNIKMNSSIKSLKNDSEEKSISSSKKKSEKSNNDNKSNKMESSMKNLQNQFLVSKQKELNFSGITPKPNPINNNIPKDNGVYTLSLSTIPEETTPQIISQETNNIMNNLGEYIKTETLPQPQEIINQEVIFPSPSGKGFKFCSQLTKAGKNLSGLEKTDQDTPLIYLNVGGIEGFNIFGVLDGHGDNGHFVSQFCKNYFVNKMKTYVENLVYITQYITAEDIYINLKSSNYSYIVELFINADNELQSQNSFDSVLSGTTCNLIFQLNKHLIDFNVGDSRSILIEDSGDYTHQVIHPLSVDHKPDIPEELQRIQAYGGTVQRIRDAFGNELGPMRVFKLGYSFPGLAMSRSLGDFQAKECGVISTPQVLEYEINTNTKFLVVCSDGIWEFMSNEQVRDVGNNFYKINDASRLCSELVNMSVNLWGQRELIRDDITVVAVLF